MSDDEWSRIESLMPSASSKGGRPFWDHRRVIEAIVWQYRVGAPLAIGVRSGANGVWKRHRRFSEDGTWDKILAVLLSEADVDGSIDWQVIVDWTVNRAHQHATNLARFTGVSFELQESVRAR